MKKFLAIALCALMMTAMIASVCATDYIFEYDFEDDVEGDFIAIDASLRTTPKQFSIQVVKFDNTMCMKYDRTGYVEGAGDKDCFSDMFGGGTESVWGLGPNFVLSYDIYFEKLSTGDSKSNWQIAMLRMTPAAGTQFQQSFSVIGNQIVEYSDSEAPLMEVKEGKWYNFAVAFDMKNQCFSLYVDGDLVCKDLDWNCADTSATEAERMRIAWAGSTGDSTGDGVAYVDNFKAYNADKPENASGKTAETLAPAPETEAPATEAPATEAPVTAAPTTTPAPSTDNAAQTADIAVVIAAVAAIAGSGAVIVKKKH